MATPIQRRGYPPPASLNSSAPPRRIFPRDGRRLDLGAIRGPWRPSGAVHGCGVFAVIWSTRNADYWAPLHDFEPSAQLRLIELCRHLDVDQFGGVR
jgi:hypothetical protein